MVLVKIVLFGVHYVDVKKSFGVIIQLNIMDIILHIAFSEITISDEERQMLRGNK